MDASILPHLLSFWTLSFPFIVSAFVHKTQSRDPPLQGNFISQSRLIRISPILDLPDTFLLPPQLSAAPPTHHCRHLYYYPLQKNQLLYVHRTLFFDTAGWRLAQVQQKYSHLFYDECQHILKLLAESQWLASNPTVEIKKSSRSARTRYNICVRLSFTRFAVSSATCFAGFWCATIALAVLYETWRSFF